MHPKITSDHLGRGAAVYVRQSTMGQVAEHTESQRRQYALAESARTLGFASVTVVDDDLGRSGSGVVERPGFQKLVASVCSGAIVRAARSSSSCVGAEILLVHVVLHNVHRR
jgi:DNA invertase Pin-like site-specific DNA recombinase